ncbi:MAG: TonB-dependent receptor, partial [bacterium]|nr:TonB-dependent receptor [bacterium]
KKIYLFTLFVSVFLLQINVTFGQTREIKGTITNAETDSPISKIKVSVKGTNISTNSDKNGEYTLMVPDSIETITFDAFSAMKVAEIVRVTANNIDIFLSPKEVFDLTLEELMDYEIKIASGEKALTARESPGIISIVTNEEIEKSGASDLIDVLRLVPGIEFAVDQWGATGLTIRGNMGYMGRVLLMIDGQETNELLYACTFLGNHYPVSNIEKIEIIRGPGSSIYGGFAELGVINVITKSGKELNGISASVDYGQMMGDASHSNATISIGKEHKDFEFAIHGFYGLGNRSDREFTDIYGYTYDMANQAKLNTISLNSMVSYKGISARFIYDDYTITSRDWYGEMAAKDYSNENINFFGELKYNWELSDKITITSKYNFKHNTPWRSIDEPIDDVFEPLDKSIMRNTINIAGIYNANDNINIVAGGEYYIDNAKRNIEGDVFWNGSPEISYSLFSGFIQGIINTKFINITLGGRIDKHSESGIAFSPRICLTKVYDKFHIKLLYSHAFRSPVIDEIDYSYLDPVNNEPITKPEKAKIFELETGVKLSKDISLIGNYYYIYVDNTLVYTYTDDDEGYTNEGTCGSTGFELEFRMRKKWGYATLNYSYYNTKNINNIAYYAAGDEESVLLATSPHKISFNSSFNIYKGLSVNP